VRDQIIAAPGGDAAQSKAAPMRFSSIVPPRRPLFGRRQDPPVVIVPTPTSEERRLIDRIIRHAGYGQSR